jgi:hypothetical protein
VDIRKGGEGGYHDKSLLNTPSLLLGLLSIGWFAVHIELPFLEYLIDRYRLPKPLFTIKSEKQFILGKQF